MKFANYILITQKNCCRRRSTAWAKLPVSAEERFRSTGSWLWDRLIRVRFPI